DGRTELFVYNGNQITASFDGAGSQTHRYLFGRYSDQILAEDSDGRTLWSLADQIGTVHDLADSSGTVVNHIRYTAFGGIISQSDLSVGVRFAFTGREFDAETGLYYYRARYLDPVTGRFLSADPSGFNAGDANLYRYVGNNPITRLDPSGRFE